LILFGVNSVYIDKTSNTYNRLRPLSSLFLHAIIEQGVVFRCWWKGILEVAWVHGDLVVGSCWQREVQQEAGRG
jgi:hypothetical protein